MTERLQFIGYAVSVFLLFGINSGCGRNSANAANVANAASAGGTVAVSTAVNAAGAPADSSEKVLAEVSGELPPVLLDHDNVLDSYSNQPLPALKLTLSNLQPDDANNSDFTVELPEEARVIVTDYWRIVLKADLLDETGKYRDGDHFAEEFKKRFYFANDVSLRLQQVEITTPVGTRKITAEMAVETLRLLASLSRSQARAAKDQLSAKQWEDLVP